MDKALQAKGMAMRKSVLGAEYVDNAMKNVDDFNRPFQDLLNEYCWGFAWTDERLPKKTRSIMNLCMLAALNRMHEWELHFKGAMNNGCTRDELQAILHQIAVYCGVPVTVECMRIAKRVFAEMDKGKKA
jgi:4-carboxymuconolactone decarboxylase